MKKNIIILSLIIVSLFSTQESFADLRCPTDPVCPGDNVIDITRLTEKSANFIIDKGIQIKKIITDSIIDIGVTATQINTYKTMWDQTIGRPLKDAMTLMAIAKDSEQILNLVNGSSGGNSLLVANPEEYIKTKGLNAMRSSYNEIEKNGGVYADSFLNNIVATARDSVDTASLSQSSIPSTVQKAACEDKTLSQMARDEVSENNTVKYTDKDYKEKKDFLYKELCTADPIKNKEVAGKLLALSKQKPSLGMWDNWLATTGGDNDYARKIKKDTLTEQKVKNKQASALQDMNNGQGIKSATICVEYDSKGSCTKEEVINPAGAIKDAFSKAKTAAMDTAISTFGTGGDGGSFLSEIGDILSLAGDAYNAYNQVTGVIGQVNGAIGEVTGAINQVTGEIDKITNSIDKATSDFDKLTGGSGNNNSANRDAVLTSRRTAPRISNTSTVTSKSYAPDLAGSTDRKDTILLPIQRILNAHLSSVNDLTKIDNDYIDQINYYKTLVEGVRSCYKDVETYASTYATGTPYSNYSTPPAVTDFYNHEMKLSNDLIDTLTNERNVTVPQAKSIIESTLTKVNNSNSSEEIVALTNKYQDIVDSNGLPTASSNGTRDGEYQIYKGDVESKTMGQGGITTQNKACADALTAVKAAITERDRPVYNYGNSYGN